MKGGSKIGVVVLGHLGLAFFWASPARSEEAFPPQSTWIFMAGLLEWEDEETFASFPKENRQDKNLLAFFRKAGVPAAQTLGLHDRKATLVSVRRNLEEFVRRIPADGVLLFYYCGHGYEEGGGAAFAAWDASEAGGWGMEEVVRTVRDGFGGRRALLLADCCHSGALVESIVRLGSRTRNGAPLAAVSSSSARESSTGDWTFTESFLDALQGRPWADLDRSGHVTLGEFAEWAQEEMAAFQAQRASSQIPVAWTPDAVLARTSGPAGGRVGQRIQARSEGDWWKGRIVEESDGAFRIRFLGFFEEDDLWIAPQDIKPLEAPPVYAVGRAVEVKWRGEWWPARVLKERDGTHLIRYDGYGSEWDEWAPPERLRPLE